MSRILPIKQNGRKYSLVKTGRSPEDNAVTAKCRKRQPKFLFWAVELLLAVGFNVAKRYVKAWTASLAKEETPSGGLLFYRLKREPRAEIDLQEVVLGTVNDIPCGFGEHSDMGSKAVLESPTKVAQHPVTKAQAPIRAYPIVPRE